MKKSTVWRLLGGAILLGAIFAVGHYNLIYWWTLVPMAFAIAYERFVVKPSIVKNEDIPLPSSRAWTIGVVSIVIGIAVAFFLWPQSLESCKAAAYKLPTEQGVRMATRDCLEKYVYGPEKKAKLERQQKKKVFWDGMLAKQGEGFTKANFILEFGPPVAEGNKHLCEQTATLMCQWADWESDREGQSCLESIAPMNFVYRTEFSESGNLTRWYVEPIHRCMGSSIQ